MQKMLSNDKRSSFFFPEINLYEKKVLKCWPYLLSLRFRKDSSLMFLAGKPY
jgi:hypothetical protein